MLQSENQVLFVKSIPHEWLLPQCAASVIHGGAGTTAAAIRAGKPVIICPFLCDQPVRLFYYFICVSHVLIDNSSSGPKSLKRLEYHQISKTSMHLQ